MEFNDPNILYCIGLGLGGFMLSFITVFNFIRVKKYIKPEVVPVKDLTTGKHEVRGKIVALEESITPPWHGEKSVFYHLRYYELIPAGRHDRWDQVIDDVKYVRAGVRDDSGTVEVLLHRAENRCSRKEKIQADELFQEAHEVAAKYRRTLPATTNPLSMIKPMEFRLIESWMPVGTQVYVMGATEMHDGVPVMQTGNEPLIISDTSLSGNARHPLPVYKFSLILAVACFAYLFHLISKMAL